MSRKQLLLIITTVLCTLILSSSLVLGDQQVKIPYVVSTGDWWTGITITNNSSNPITDMKLSFTKNNGASGWYMPPLHIATPPPSERTAPLGIFMPYATNLEEIAGHALLVNTVAALYTGDGTKTLPSENGSVILSHTGSEQFSVTVYIGSSLGFAFQVFESSSP